MLISNLNSKGRTTIPIQVRKALNLKPGDQINFEIKNHKVIISKIERFDYCYHKTLSSTLLEWNSSEDDEAYRHL